MRTKNGDVTEIEAIALDLETAQLAAHLLQAVDDVLHHDVLQGEEGEARPVAEHARVEAAGVVAAEEHRLQVRAAVGDGGQLLVRRAAVEYLRELGVRPLLVAEYLLEPCGGEDKVAEREDIGTGLQNHTRPVPFHLQSPQSMPGLLT